MKSSSQVLIHRALAAHLGIEMEAIEDEQRVGRDLGLRALDLVLVALRLEARTPEHGEFPVEGLDPAMTVGELGALYATWVRPRDGEGEEEEGPDTLRMLMRPPPSVRRPGFAMTDACAPSRP